MIIKLDGELFRIHDLMHVTPGNLRGFVRVKGRNLRTQTMSEQKLRSEDVVERATLPVLVDFWAPWCGPCRMMAPQFEAAAERMEPFVRLAKVDTQAQQALGARFGIRSIPTLALFLEGKEIARQPGAMNAADILRWTATNLTEGGEPA